jgi:hypothetical protein
MKMQIVINIPEEEYKCIQITGCIGNKTCISNAIYNGVPLPKGHGDLIDISKLPVTTTYFGISDIPREVVKYNSILHAKKIIKADKIESEDK